MIYCKQKLFGDRGEVNHKTILSLCQKLLRFYEARLCERKFPKSCF